MKVQRGGLARHPLRDCVQVAHLLRREEKVNKAHGHAKLLAKNYKCLLLMCERHPAHSKV